MSATDVQHLYIIRHGETEYNRQHIIQGSGVDTSLNGTGLSQAEAFHERYRDIPFDLVITSALRRSRETVSKFIESGIPHVIFPEINEINWGVYEGQPQSPEAEEMYANILEAWGAGNFEKRIPGGESAAELASRVQSFIDVLDRQAEKNILICTHGRTLRCLMCLLEGRALSHMQRYVHANTGLYLVRKNGVGREIILRNNLEHLSPRVTENFTN